MAVFNRQWNDVYLNEVEDKAEKLHVRAELTVLVAVLQADVVVEVLVLGHSGPTGGCQHLLISLLRSAESKSGHHTKHGTSWCVKPYHV